MKLLPLRCSDESISEQVVLLGETLVQNLEPFPELLNEFKDFFPEVIPAKKVPFVDWVLIGVSICC